MSLKDKLKRKKQSLRSSQNTKCWVAKAIALVSIYDYYDYFELILRDIYARFVKKKESAILLE